MIIVCSTEYDTAPDTAICVIDTAKLPASLAVKVENGAVSGECVEVDDAARFCDAVISVSFPIKIDGICQIVYT